MTVHIEDGGRSFRVGDDLYGSLAEALTAAVGADGGTVVATEMFEVTVTVPEPDPPTEPQDPDPDPDPDPRTVLLITEDGTLNDGNRNLRNHLTDAGWDVTVRSWTDPENYDGIDVVVISRGNPPGDTGRLLHPPVGIVAVDSWRPVGMGTNLGWDRITDVETVTPDHPLAAGIEGPFAAYQSSSLMTWNPDNVTGTTVVTRPGQPASKVVFAYEAGTAMPHRWATTRHVALGYHADGFANGLTEQAKAQLLAAVEWAADTAMVPPPANPDPDPEPDPDPDPDPDPERLSLLVTSQELAMWRDRAVNGPFRVTGDFSTNSPGHWSLMVNDANFNWSSARWAGPQQLNSNGSVKKLGETSTITANDPPAATQQMSHRMMGAAYVAVTNNNQQLAQNIVNEIRWYTQQSRLNFANRTLWPYRFYSDVNPLFMICLWTLPLVIAYDACRILVSADSQVEKWFDDLADLALNNIGTLPNVFPNRQNDDYRNRSSLVDNTTRGSTRLANGNIIQHLGISMFYNNRRSDMHALQGLVGLLLGKTVYVDAAKRYMREWLMFGNRTTANQWTSGDHNRGDSGYPQLGFSYDITALSRLIAFVEALARTGDTSLYDFSSPEGSANATWGSNHPKTMKELLQQRIDTIAGTISPQYTSSGNPPPSSVAGNERYRVKSRNTDTNREIVSDGWLICAAAYYNEPSWVNVIMRQGTPTGFTSPPQQTGAIWPDWLMDHRARFLRSLDANPYR